MISRFVLLVPSFTKKEAFKKFTDFFNYTQIFHPMFSMEVYRLALLCRVFADPVTYTGEHLIPNSVMGID